MRVNKDNIKFNHFVRKHNWGSVLVVIIIVIISHHYGG